MVDKSKFFIKNDLLSCKKSAVIIVAIIFFFKLLTVLYLVDLTKCYSPESFSGIANVSGDANSYIEPIDNYISEGNYHYEGAKAGRMPYLGLVYYPFRLFLSKETALLIVVVLQVLMESIAIYYLAKLCYRLLKSSKSFWIFITLSIMSLWVTTFSFNILTESLNVSFLSLFVYHYYVFLTSNRSKKQLLITGFFLALAVLFKPVFSLLFLLIGLELLWHNRQETLFNYTKQIASSVFIVSLPLVVLNAPWTIRNYVVYDRLMPFQQDKHAGYDYPSATMAAWKFIGAIGESIVFYDKRSAGCYFEPKEDIECEYTLPNAIFSTNLTEAKVEEARAIYIEYQNNPTDSLNELAVQKFNTLFELYKQENTFSYYFLSPLALCKYFLFHSGSYYLPIRKDNSCYLPYQWVLKISQSLLYYLSLIIGSVGCVLLFRHNHKSFIILALPIYLIIIYPLVFSYTEFRFFVPAYPFLLIGLMCIIHKVCGQHLVKKILKNIYTILPFKKYNSLQ